MDPEQLTSDGVRLDLGPSCLHPSYQQITQAEQAKSSCIGLTLHNNSAEFVFSKGTYKKSHNLITFSYKFCCELVKSV